MTAEEHIVAWIESSRPHYDRLLEIETMRKASTNPALRSCNTIERACRLVADAYREMLRTGDASRDDTYTAIELARTVSIICDWELEP